MANCNTLYYAIWLSYHSDTFRMRCDAKKKKKKKKKKKSIEDILSSSRETAISMTASQACDSARCDFRFMICVQTLSRWFLPLLGHHGHDTSSSTAFGHK